MLSIQLVAYFTLSRKEIKRFLRIFTQTLIPPAITISLYFIIFGTIIGSRVGMWHGVTYMQYITPGLIMMSVITSAFFNTVSSFYSDKFQRSIEELIVSSMTTTTILLGYITGGILRGIIVGIVVGIISMMFAHLYIHHLFIMVTVFILTSVLFSLAGLLNGMFANNWDQINMIPTFVLTPLIYLGGVFYSIENLP